VRLTVLGSSASFPGPGRACAGHLIEGDGYRVVFDLGNGTLANLTAATDAYALDAVFVTHLHPDHYLDLFALMAMLRYAPDGPCPALPLFGPTGLIERMQCLLSDSAKTDVTEAFAFTALVAGRSVSLGGLTVTPRAVEHHGETFALVAEAGGRRLCYTSDTKLSDPVREAARGADVVLAEATLPESHAGLAPHMTPRDAGTLAAGAGASRLVLTHLWPTVPRGDILDDAAATYRGTVLLAEELMRVDI
jgi:ribonuclease BN (tRNA processing enzyme)